MQTVNINGLRVAFEKAGEGEALVLLHGFTQDSRVWRPQIAGLADRLTVIAWDAPGAGQSADPSDSYMIGNWAESLSGLLDHLEISQAHILGLSWGGLLAQEFYRRYPSRMLSPYIGGYLLRLEGFARRGSC